MAVGRRIELRAFYNSPCFRDRFATLTVPTIVAEAAGFDPARRLSHRPWFSKPVPLPDSGIPPDRLLDEPNLDDELLESSI